MLVKLKIVYVWFSKITKTMCWPRNLTIKIKYNKNNRRKINIKV